MPDRSFARAILRATTARDSPSSRIQRAFEPIDDRPQYLDSRVALVLGFDQCPRRDLGTGAIDHVADCDFVLIPLLAIAPVFGSNLEAFERRMLPRPEPPKLLRLADLQPEFDDNRAAGGELFLELVDL